MNWFSFFKFKEEEWKEMVNLQGNYDVREENTIKDVGCGDGRGPTE